MAKTMALVFGIIFVLAGLLGFVSNPLIGEHGLFMSNGAYNLVFIILGVLLLIGSRDGQGKSSRWLKIVGILFIIIAGLGFLMGGSMLLGILAINAMDNWLALVLGIVLIIGGMRGNSPASQPMAPMA